MCNENGEVYSEFKFVVGGLKGDVTTMMLRQCCMAYGEGGKMVDSEEGSVVSYGKNKWRNRFLSGRNERLF